MNVGDILPYLANTFWLLVPILAFDAVFIRNLPPAYRIDIFEKGIPTWIRVPEQILRFPVFMLPLVMRLSIVSSSQRLGLWLYVVGTLIYFVSWGHQIRFPASKWSTSAAGFMAPAYTPLCWLIGIALIGDSLLLPRVAYTPWVYLGVSVLFLAFHNLHTWVVYTRTRRLGENSARTGW